MKSLSFAEMSLTNVIRSPVPQWSPDARARGAFDPVFRPGICPHHEGGEEHHLDADGERIEAV